MKILNTVVIIATLTGITASAHAEDSGAYINLGAETVEFSSYNLTARLGYQFTENFSVEAQGNLGVIDDDDFIPGIEIGVNHSFAAFVRGSVPLGGQFNMFARGGYHFAEDKVEGNGLDESLDYEGFVYGAGVEYMLDNSNGFRADVTFMEKNVGIIDVFNIGGVSSHYAVTYVRKF